MSEPYGRDHLMVIAAFRYCLGRMTYIVSDCADWLVANWESFPPKVRAIIERELESEFKRDDEYRAGGPDRHYKPLGHDCDRKQWEKVRRLYLKDEVKP